MAKLFLDNRGRAVVFDKKELVPGDMQINLSTSVDSNPAPLNVFYTGVTLSRRASVVLSKSINRTFHLFQFGETPADVTLRGVVITGAQDGRDALDSNDAVSALVQRKIKELADSSTSTATGTSTKPATEENEQSWVVDKFSGLRKKMYELTDAASILTSNIKDRAESTYGILSDNVDKGVNFLQQVGQVAGESVKTFKHALGLSQAEQILDSAVMNPKIGTVQELSAYFHAFNGGAHGDRIIVSTAGVHIEGVLVGLDIQNLKTSNGYEFTMHLKGLKFNDTSSESMWLKPVVLSTLTNGSLANIIQGGTNLGISAIRSEVTGII